MNLKIVAHIHLFQQKHMISICVTRHIRHLWFTYAEETEV